MNRNASWPIDKDTPATDLGDKRIEMLHGQRQRADEQKCYMTKQCRLGDKRIEMLHDQQKEADASSDRPGRQMNGNATWPGERGGHQQ